MTLRKPPAIAAWMLQRMTPGNYNDALAGDLLEEFRQGRPLRWYWRQAIAAVVLERSRDLCRQWPAIIFAALWALAAPAFWRCITLRVSQTNKFTSSVFHLAWPYSALSVVGWDIGSQLLFLWFGLLLYVLFYLWTGRSLNGRRITRALFAGLLLLIALLCMAGNVIDLLTPQQTATPSEISGLSVFMDLRFIVFCLPFFFGLLASILVAIPRMNCWAAGTTAMD